ncbi:MAG: ATP-binding protein [Candidatus Methanosuratincola sp.]|nr:ATP-binding protein [Candidatus Methanosuratincola sp.]
MRKIFRLRRELIEVGERRDFSKRVREEGNDEISDLAKSANWMLSSLERSSEELKRYAAHLEELVEEQTVKLREKERLAAIGETATTVGHDLRNPLQSIINIAYLMEEEVSSLPPDKREVLAKWMKRLRDNVAYMDKIVSDLQDMTRPLRVERREVRLERLFMDVLDDLKVPGNVRVNLKINPGAEKAATDLLILKRILHNLVNNALQAMPDGGRITIETSVSGGHLEIRVEDTGVGMDEETLRRIFTPLFTTKAKGTGLGLAVCKRLIEELGGDISVKSSKGMGTTFTLSLPIYDAGEQGKQAQ